MGMVRCAMAPDRSSTSLLFEMVIKKLYALWVRKTFSTTSTAVYAPGNTIVSIIGKLSPIL